jgi:hypothetical protein
VLVTFLVWGTRVFKSASRRRSARAQHGRIPFPVTSQASGRKVGCQQPRFTNKENRRSSGFRGCQVARDLARRVAPIVQGKSGSSDPIGTGGGQSAYRGSVFRETWSLPFFTAEITDRRNAESTFGAEPTVLAPGHIKRACKWGQPPL